MFNLLNQLIMKYLRLTTNQADMLEYFIGEFMLHRELPNGWRCRTYRGYEFGGEELKTLLNSVQVCYWDKE